MFQVITDESQFLLLVFNLYMCRFEIYDTLIAPNNRQLTGLPINMSGHP
jgi:hypothetical protein